MADKLKIAKHFILSSPYGQLKDVIAGSFSFPSDCVPPHSRWLFCVSTGEREHSLFTATKQRPVLDLPSVL
jgi:hypothetical protein